MRNLFPGYYRLNQDEMNELWEKAVFIVDANVLLNLYRYPKDASDDLLSILSEVSSRLWIPFQAALEYQMKRLTVIAEQMKKYSEVRSAVEKNYNNLAHELENLQLKKRHSTIKTDAFMEELKSINDRFFKELEQQQAQQPDVYDDDELRKTIDILFHDKIGEPPKLQDDLEKWYIEGKSRYEQLIPPGYRDVSKNKEEIDYYMYNGLIFKREYGDLMIWLQIMDYTKNNDLKNVIFITDDDKADWWWFTEKQGKKKIGVRPELIEEIKKKSQVSLFHMYSSESLMVNAKQYLKANIKEESIKQVREISRLDRVSSDSKTSTSYISKHEQVRELFVDRLSQQYPTDIVEFGRREYPPILLIKSKDNSRIGYEVMFVRHASSGIMRLRDRLYRGYYEVHENRLHEMVFVIIADSIDILNEIYTRWYRLLQIEEGSGVRIEEGYIQQEGETMRIMFPPG